MTIYRIHLRNRSFGRTFATYEARFRDGNGVPTAADVLYRNPEAIQNRLKLFHLFRLRSQLQLDLPKLSQMKNKFEVPKGPLVRISTKIPDGRPGIETHYDPNHGGVTVSVLVRQLKLTATQRKFLIKLAGDRYKVDNDALSFEVGDFPLKEQNERKAMEILRELMVFVKDPTNDQFKTIALPKLKSNRRPELEFPRKWLPKIKASS